jgi:hypothetical protein
MTSKNCETIFPTLPTHLLIRLSKTQIKPSPPRLKTKQVSFLDGVTLTPKIPGLFMPISTSKMLKLSKKSQKKLKKLKMLKFQPHKDYDLLDSLKKSCQKILKILTVVACLSSSATHFGFCGILGVKVISSKGMVFALMNSTKLAQNMTSEQFNIQIPLIFFHSQCLLLLVY